ncbi:MAG: ABC transporter ATP-binding protein [Planctomycetota bacterium]|nr:ABC transporter ATP-binding protein [Planctomycetota bacterium]
MVDLNPAGRTGDPIIDVVNVTKCYEGGKAALTEAHMRLHRGELVALVGPNGAGKSTLLKCMAGLVRPQEGSITVAGKDRFRDHLAIRTFTAYLPDQPNMFVHFRGIEHLQMIGDLYGVELSERNRRIESFARLFDLDEILEKRIATYSNGQYKKLALAATFLTNARIYLLDEPETGGIDPPASAALMQILRMLRDRKDVTIVWATQIVEMAEKLCDRVAIVDDGRVQAFGTMNELRARYQAPGADLGRLFGLVTGKDKQQLISEVLESMAHNAEEAPRRIAR